MLQTLCAELVSLTTMLFVIVNVIDQILLGNVLLILFLKTEIDASSTKSNILFAAAKQECKTLLMVTHAQASSIAHLFADKYEEFYTCVDYNDVEISTIKQDIDDLVGMTVIVS